MAENVKDIDSVSQIKPIRLNDIVKDVKKYNQLVSSVASAKAEVGKHTKKIEKASGYNLKAFKACVALDKMTPLKRADYLMTFDAMREKLGWDDEQADMLAEEESNVTHMNGGVDDDDEDEAPAASPETYEEGIAAKSKH